MRHIFRCLVLALASLSITACSIGEGNGIVSIQIVPLDGSTDFKLRSDQCEGLLLGVIATFTDGQQLFYSSRSSFSLVEGNATVTELKNSADFTTSAELIPTADAKPGETVKVKATYLSLEAEQEFTFSDVTIDSFQLEPAQVALITGESQNILPVLSLSDGSRQTGLVRALDFELSDETAFTLGGFTTSGLQILDTTDTTGSIETAELTATYCGRVASKDQSASLTATKYSGNDATLEIRSNFDGNGFKAADGTAVDLPNSAGATVSAHLLFPNNSERTVTSLATWLSSSPDDTTYPNCAETEAKCSARITPLSGVITTDSELTGETKISATVTTADGEVIDSQNPLLLNVSPIDYQDPAFKLKDEANHQITINDNGPTIGMASGTGRSLKFVAQLTNADTASYELAVNAVFISGDTDKVVTENTILAATGDEPADNVVITVDTSAIPGAIEGSDPFTNNIPSFLAEVHLNEPTGFIVDATNDATSNPTEDTTLTLTAGSTHQLRSFLLFSEGNIVRTGATAWSSSEPTVAAVSNISNSGFVTTFQPGSTIITARHSFLDADGDLVTETREITITVN